MRPITAMGACAVLVWSAVAVAALGQVPVRDAGQPVPVPKGSARIAGTVKDQTGAPVRRATVTISGDMRLDRMTVTDEEGRFALTDLPSGRFTITAKKAGYPQVSHGAKRPHRPGAGLFLQEGEQATGLNLVLARGAALTGTVYDELGVPMPGVPVEAWSVRTALGGDRTLDSAGPEPVTVVTDDRGMYRVFGLPPGEYTIGTSWFYHGDPFEVRRPTVAELRAAFPSGPRMTQPPPSTAGQPIPEQPRYNYTPVFSPGVLDPLAADTFTLKPGEERAGVDLRMQFQPTARIEGTLVNPAGDAVDTQLRVTRRSSVRALNTTQVRPGQTGGKFTIESLSPGLYTVTAQTRDGAQGAPLWARADVTLAGGAPTPVVLSLEPATSVTGRLVFEGTTLPPPPDLTRVAVSLVDQSPASMRAGATKIDATGVVAIPGVVPGEYMARASVPGGIPPSGPAWTVRSVTIGGRDVTDRTFEISPGGASDLTVTFTSLVSELSGTVTTPAGAPETDYFVIAVPADRAYWTPFSRRIVSTRPDGMGRYLFRGLPPGDYRVAVTTDLVPRDLQEASTLEQLAAQSLPVTVVIGERRTLNLRTSTFRP